MAARLGRCRMILRRTRNAENDKQLSLIGYRRRRGRFLRSGLPARSSGMAALGVHVLMKSTAGIVLPVRAGANSGEILANIVVCDAEAL